MQGPGPSEAGSSRTPGHAVNPNTVQFASSDARPSVSSAPNATNYPFYNYSPQTWAQSNQWQAYAPHNMTYNPRTYQPYSSTSLQPVQTPVAPLRPSMEEKSVQCSPSPTPAPPFHNHWDTVIKRFLSAAGLTQALRGFQSDMLVMSPEWEQDRVPTALASLREDLVCLEALQGESQLHFAESDSLEERKLQHAHFASGVEPRTPSTITKSISQFLAQNRARNDASNRKEFLLSLAEKRQRLYEAGDVKTSDSSPSCARTDAKTQNREIQMRYDIVKNEDGPLRKTLKRDHDNAEADVATVPTGSKAQEVTADRYPGLDERVRSVETHVAVRYVPSPPHSLLDRLKFLEDHLVRLEKEYPPWAALHFNQPHRGWPPPPRPTPIIVPSHLSSLTEPSQTNPQTPIPLTNATSAGGGELASKAKGKTSGRNAMSTLHRAVMDRLEVQKAMDDLEGRVKTEPSS